VFKSLLSNHHLAVYTCYSREILDSVSVLCKPATCSGYFCLMVSQTPILNMRGKNILLFRHLIMDPINSDTTTLDSQNLTYTNCTNWRAEKSRPKSSYAFEICHIWEVRLEDAKSRSSRMA